MPLSYARASAAEIYPLSLHDALPICRVVDWLFRKFACQNSDSNDNDYLVFDSNIFLRGRKQDRKSTRLNSSHVASSYAVFCLKKKRKSTSAKTQSRATQSGQATGKQG